MSIDLLKTELASLADHDRRRILAWLISLGDGRDPNYPQELARRIDDPHRWLTEEEMNRRLGPLEE